MAKRTTDAPQEHVEFAIHQGWGWDAGAGKRTQRQIYVQTYDPHNPAHVAHIHAFLLPCLATPLLRIDIKAHPYRLRAYQSRVTVDADDPAQSAAIDAAIAAIVAVRHGQGTRAPTS